MSDTTPEDLRNILVDLMIDSLIEEDSLPDSNSIMHAKNLGKDIRTIQKYYNSFNASDPDMRPEEFEHAITQIAKDLELVVVFD